MPSPRLNPALRRLWRRDGTVQFGIEPEHAVVVEGLTGDDEPLLDALSRGTPGHVEPANADPKRAAALTAALAAAGALSAGDPPDPQAAAVPEQLRPDALAMSLLDRGRSGAAVIGSRSSASVEIHGAGRVGGSLAALLSAAGVGRVDPVDRGAPRPADLAPGGLRTCAAATRGAAASALVAAWRTDRAPVDRLAGTPVPPPRRRRLEATPGQGPTIGHLNPPDVCVLAPVGVAVEPEVAALVSGRPHLEVSIRETVARIGPLVIPGRTSCRRCDELRRADRDPHWPWLSAQLAGSASRVEPNDLCLSVLTAALAALHLLRWLDAGPADRLDTGRHPLLGGALHLSLTDLRPRRRTVPAHPDCGCGAAG